MKRGTIEKLRNIKNEISYIHYKTEQRKQVQSIKTSTTPTDITIIMDDENQQSKELSRLNKLYALKNTITNELIELQNAYSIIDTIFYREISSAEKKQNRWWFCLVCFYWNNTDSSQDYMIDELVQQLSPALRPLILPMK